MKIINSRLHGILDYVVGLILAISPWIFDFANNEAQTWIPVILGAGAWIYSAFTKYELAIFRMLNFKSHLTIDFLSGVLLAASPWIFGFSDNVYIPHLIFGLLEIVVVTLTNKHTSLAYVRS